MQLTAWWIASAGWGIFLGSIIASLWITQSLCIQLDGLLLVTGGTLILREGRGWKVAVLVYLLLCILTAIACAVWAILDPTHFRIGYMGLSFSHPTGLTVSFALLISAVVFVPPATIIARSLTRQEFPANGDLTINCAE